MTIFCLILGFDLIALERRVQFCKTQFRQKLANPVSTYAWMLHIDAPDVIGLQNVGRISAIAAASAPSAAATCRWT